MAKDYFADIAAGGIGGRSELLCEQTPAPHDRTECRLGAAAKPVEFEHRSNSKEELYAELEALREKMRPFLADNAPEIKQYSKRKYIDEFLLDKKERVKIPHYGGPIGYEKQVYEAEFDISRRDDKAYYVCFNGADYYAVVYVNDTCVGTHEGFFSPFEFQITDEIRDGKNSLKIELYNDYIYMGNGYIGEEQCEGDKLYAATGLGWDDPAEGWHHCPAGMGIYAGVYIEERNPVHISELYVRALPEENAAELWIEVNNAFYDNKNIQIKYSVYGQNFIQTVCENEIYTPKTANTVGLGDSFTAAQLKDEIGCGIDMPAKNGRNLYKIRIKMENARLWDTDTPYLYQLQVTVITDGAETDCKCTSFGMRSFREDLKSEKKGMLYLNGRKIRLRGANTMGFEQQDVLRGDIKQLIDDILLAKLCNMNFLRLTQRPVQNEVYEYCDRLGLMTQTDLPLFGCMRRTKLCEGVRQAEEMERIVRKHPCNVIISYINEPFPNANNEPHRHLERNELEDFFTMCNLAVKMQNPDQVIKHIDGDYDPPTEGMPDNHCYPMWYNGHGIDIGRLYKGYWLSVKPGRYYGCGEYGAEGLDFCEVMRECYPKEWIKEPFDPSNIVRAQTGSFHRFFYDTQDTMEDWVRESQEHQRFATKLMTEAFRRNDNMISNAIHLFIDAWPSGWMKTIMDCRRNPKPAYFAYRDALSPVLVSMRSDRFTYFSGETISVESYVCNDTSAEGAYSMVFELYGSGKMLASGRKNFKMRECCAEYCCDAVFTAPETEDRESLALKAYVLDEKGKAISENLFKIEVFADVEVKKNENVVLINPPVGEHIIAGERVTVKECGMLPVHFVSAKTGHSLVKDFKTKDFSYWYDKSEDMITPIAEKTFTADGFEPVLISMNKNEEGEWTDAVICGEKEYEGKRYVICTADLRCENPVAKRFLANVMNNGCR